MSKILIITTEFLSFKNSPTGGRGVRIENLADGLKKHGHTIFFSFLKENLEKLEKVPPEKYLKYLHNYFYDNIILQINPDVIIFSPWTLILDFNNDELLEKHNIILDLCGPLILENAFQKNENNFFLGVKKINALNKADILIYSNPRQKYYLLSWLLLSGHKLNKKNMINVPISYSKKLEQHSEYIKPPVFIFAGILWKWQKFGNNLKIIAEFLEKKNGILKCFCGSFLYSEDENLEIENLKKYSSVEYSGIIDYFKLIEQYKNSSVSIELYLPNYERELATTTRTLTTLACGVPIIYSTGMYFSEFIKEYDAGWVINPEDKTELLSALNEIWNNPEICQKKGKNAQKLILEKFNNINATSELNKYCDNPYKNSTNKNFFLETSTIFKNHSRLILELKDELKQKNNRINELNNQIQELNEKSNCTINFLKEKNEFLENDLNRIKNRKIFQILLKIKKICDAILGKI